MATTRQVLGLFGEQRVVQDCACPRCKRAKTLVRLPPNFKCADVICDFCGYLAQVKTTTATDVNIVPRTLLGAAWGPQKARMDAAIYFPLFLVLVEPNTSAYAIYFLSADLQRPDIFRPRSPLSANARRAGLAGLHLQSRAGTAVLREASIGMNRTNPRGLIALAQDTLAAVRMPGISTVGFALQHGAARRLPARSS